MQPVELPCGAVIVREDYSGAIDTVEAAIRFLKEVRAKRKLPVITDLADSEGNQKRRMKLVPSTAAPAVDVLTFRSGSLVGYGRRIRGLQAGALDFDRTGGDAVDADAAGGEFPSGDPGEAVEATWLQPEPMLPAGQRVFQDRMA